MEKSKPKVGLSESLVSSTAVSSTTRERFPIHSFLVCALVLRHVTFTLHDNDDDEENRLVTGTDKKLPLNKPKDKQKVRISADRS